MHHLPNMRSIESSLTPLRRRCSVTNSALLLYQSITERPSATSEFSVSRSRQVPARRAIPAAQQLEGRACNLECGVVVSWADRGGINLPPAELAATSVVS